MRFEIQRDPKHLIFDSDLRGLKVHGVEYISGQDGVLIYDKTRGLRADEVELQMSTNTSTLIPALHVLRIAYNSYFDERPVVESQNAITFYWNPSRLAAFYNQFSTDELEYRDREPVIRRAVDFLASNSASLPLQEEFLVRMLEPCKLLGFYQGFPIFDSSVGFAKLLSRLGIHVGTEEVMVSTPLDRYESDVYELAELLSKETGLSYSKKKNRVLFPRNPNLLKLLGVRQSN
ncbi:MAG TPA: hypothetical protein VK249_24520 [Anaerolineales bacterium]|nr:hypothetical protein [Anaerolineales bacterium]